MLCFLGLHCLVLSGIMSTANTDSANWLHVWYVE